MGLLGCFASFLPVLGNGRFLESYRSLFVWVQLCADIAVVCITLYGLTYLQLSVVSPFYSILAIVAVLCLLLVYQRRGSSTFKRTPRLPLYWAVPLLVLVFIGLVTKTSVLFLREMVIEWILLAVVLEILNHYVSRNLYGSYKEQSVNSLPVIVIGTGSLVRYPNRNLIVRHDSNQPNENSYGKCYRIYRLCFNTCGYPSILSTFNIVSKGFKSKYGYKLLFFLKDCIKSAAIELGVILKVVLR